MAFYRGVVCKHLFHQMCSIYLATFKIWTMKKFKALTMIRLGKHDQPMYRPLSIQACGCVPSST